MQHHRQHSSRQRPHGITQLRTITGPTAAGLTAAGRTVAGRTLAGLTVAVLALAALLSLVTTGRAVAQRLHFSELERHIIELEDQRVAADSITPYLASTDSAVAWRAAVALANLGDTTARQPLLGRLRSESRKGVREAVAFAIGMLGENPSSIATTNRLMESALKEPTQAGFEAIGRVIRKSDVPVLTKFMEKSLERKLAPASFLAAAMLRLSLRKIYTERSLAIIDELAENDDPEARWRAAYCYARDDDSARLSSRLKVLGELLLDQGSVNARMFAALALGRVHNSDASTMLLHAAHAEPDWRVNVMILQAIARLPKLDTVVAQTLEGVVDASTKTDHISEHLAHAALSSMEQMVVAGKLPSTLDSNRLRDWLHDYAPRMELHYDASTLIRAETCPILARLGTPDIIDEIADISTYKDPYVRANGVRAAVGMSDTLLFGEMLQSMSLVSALDQYFRLEALDSMWQHAQKQPKFLEGLEVSGFANAYRHMLIRISDFNQDPAVVCTSLSQIEDSTVLRDTAFRNEARGYLLRYVKAFNTARFHDQLLATIDAIKWLKPSDEEVKTSLTDLYRTAAKEGWPDVADSLKLAMGVLGMKTDGLSIVKRHAVTYNWDWFESTPDTILFTLPKGQAYIALLKRDAPLTVMNMLKLTNEGVIGNSVFHRVVPAFVVQSGDPTGSGWGNPGWAIRTEVSPTEYDQPGMIGMASDGKDTEGSQWFITHVATPNLDGHYTIWAKVAKRMDLVNEIQLGDKILGFLPLNRTAETNH